MPATTAITNTEDILDSRDIIERIEYLMDPGYCYDLRHETPCPLPCAACEEECR